MSMVTPANAAPLRQRLFLITESNAFQRFIIVLIAVNAIILGFETSDEVMAQVGRWLILADQIILSVFVIELLMRFGARGVAMLKDPWSVFDIVVVSIALVPATDTFEVLRALRVLRVLRLASAVPRMRRVVEALLHSLPGLGAVVAILGLLFYVAGVMATQLFGDTFPQWFGSLARSLYSLFQIMTLESWSMGIVRPVMKQHPYAWAFFVPFILLATFTMLNLFIAVVVNAMQNRYHAEEAAHAEAAHQEREQLLDEVRGLRAQVATLSQLLERPDSASRSDRQ